MFLFLQKFFDPSGFLPLGECYSWNPGALLINISGDSLIAGVYFLAPFIFLYLVKKRRLPLHRKTLFLFSLFIWVCGLRHLLEIVTIWEPVFYLQGFTKLASGLLAISAIAVLYRSFPQALGLDKADKLEKVNSSLLDEVAERERAQIALRQANEALESRVQQRTAQLIKTNRELEKEIEQRKKTEEDLRQKNKELTTINAELDSFVFHASHDLKDPIIKIEGLVSALKEEIPQSNPHVNQIFQHLDGSLLKVDKTVLDLTEVGRIQKPGGAETYEDVPFALICSEVRADLQTQLDQANASVSVDFEKAPTVYFSPENLRRIFATLLTNALQMRDPARPLKLAISTENVKGFVLLRISDNGLGVDLTWKEDSEEGQELVSNERNGGFGLPFYIVKRILNNCQGKLNVETVPGKGSTFAVFLPSKS